MSPQQTVALTHQVWLLAGGSWPRAWIGYPTLKVCEFLADVLVGLAYLSQVSQSGGTFVGTRSGRGTDVGTRCVG
ncbi:MAG: hypothetical protein BWY63_03390 [Chloroflexi bacterium ADurb.Bin360]|nr:MAG: hypothetical protein BWY63_03390 [Chloroflexi bacterium ADurb.Bin360]